LPKQTKQDLHGLALSGVCHAQHVAMLPVRSYIKDAYLHPAPFHLCPLLLPTTGSLFSVTLSVRLLVLDVIQHCALSNVALE
jgi:hypothetical protein